MVSVQTNGCRESSGRRARHVERPRHRLERSASTTAQRAARGRGASWPCSSGVPRPNWFFAFPIDGSFVLELPELPSSFRRFHPEDVHLTLAFLDGCGEDRAMRALAALDAHLKTAPVAP